MRYAEVRQREREDGEEAAEEVRAFLSSTVKPESRQEALTLYERTKRFNEHAFLTLGRTLAEWGVAELLEEEEEQENLLWKRTDLHMQDIPEANPIRRFVESFRRTLWEQKLRGSLFS